MAQAPIAFKLGLVKPLVGGGVVGVLFLLRVIADTSSGLSWLRWTTPLGWAEELRPFTGIRPAVLLLPLAAGLAP